MVCIYCGKPASPYVKKTDGKEVTVCLCPACYRKMKGEGAAAEDREVKRCASCGTTLADFRRTGLLGCAECYRVFRADILPALRTVQKGICHEGKEPIVPVHDDYSDVFVREGLKAELEQALREKDYGEAKRLRDALKRLNGAEAPQ